MKRYSVETAPTKILKKFYDKSIKSNSFAKILSIPIKKELEKRQNIKPQTVKPQTVKPQNVNVTVPKSKPIKYASIGRKQMKIGRSGTVITSGGLLANNKTTIKKKTLLGA